MSFFLLENRDFGNYQLQSDEIWKTFFDLNDIIKNH